MNILLTSGFLGSGKSTILSRIVRGMTENGLAVAIIENEIGEVGIDDAMFDVAQVEVTSLFGGCVCCTITGSLLDAVAQIGERITPDWIVVEMTGLALMTSISNAFEQYDRSGSTVYKLAVTDIERWDVIVRAMEHVLRNQLEGADGVIINKVDAARPSVETLGTISEFSQGAPQLCISAINMTPDELWPAVMNLLGIDGGG